RPLEALVTNIRGSEIILEKAHKYGRKVLITSTSEIYGKSPEVPMHEDSERLLGAPLGRRWRSSTSKPVDAIRAHADWPLQRLPLPGPARPVPGRVRRGLRGHAPAGARHHPGAQARRLRARDLPGRDRRHDDRRRPAPALMSRPPADR